MSVSGAILGVLALALAVSMAMGILLHVIGPVQAWQGLISAVLFIAVGAVLSGFALLRARRVGSRTRMPLTALALNAGAVAAAVTAAVLVVVVRAEPSLEETIRELNDEGLTVHTIGGERPALLILPSGHGPDSPLPLVISLHGYGLHYRSQDSLFGLSPLVESHDFALLLANGVKDNSGSRFWNATDFCCGDDDSRVDDFGWLAGLAEEAGDYVEVDGVFAAGFSNGGYMSYRLACDSFPGLAAIVILGGSSFSDASRCDRARPLSVLHIHGTADDRTRIEGGSNAFIGEGSYPGAREVVRRWAQRAGCDPSSPERLPDLDLDTGIDGDETSVTRYGTGCRENLLVEYWEMEFAGHFAHLAPDFAERIVSWLLDRSQ